MPDALQFEFSWFRESQQILKPEQQKQDIPNEHSSNQPGRPRSRHNPDKSDQQSDKEPCAEADPEPPRRMRTRGRDGRDEGRSRIHFGTSTADRISAITESAVRPSRSASGFSIKRWRRAAGAAALISSGIRK